VGIQVDLGVEAAKLEGVPEAQKFLTSLWASISPKDPIRILLADDGRPSVQYPRKGIKLKRQVMVSAPVKYYAHGAKVRAVVKAVRLDPVAAALRGELYMQDFDEDALMTPGESAVFLATYIMWNVLRKYKLIPGRKGKAASARYAFGALRAFRAAVEKPEVVHGQV